MLEVRNKKYSFQCWRDVPGQEERQQIRVTIGSVKQMTKSEAHKKLLEYVQAAELNSGDYQMPSSKTFADAVKFYTVRGTNYCRDALYPALKKLGLPQGAFKAFRGGRDEDLILDGVKDRVRLHMMGHGNNRMTDVYVGSHSVAALTQSLSRTYGVAVGQN
jgi:hypothetical protein